VKVLHKYVNNVMKICKHLTNIHTYQVVVLSQGNRTMPQLFISV